MAETDAYGNALPRGTRAQLAKEVGLYRRIGRELAQAAQDTLDNQPSEVPAVSYLPIKETFQTGFDQYSERNGEAFDIVGYIDEHDAEHDAENLPMFRIRFEDGEEIEAWPYEIFRAPGSGMDAP